MPYQSTWVDPDVCLKYNGVTVYHVYRNNDYDEPMLYWYTLVKDSQGFEDDSFDVRSLIPGPEKDHVAVLKQAIDEGILTPDLPADEIDKKTKKRNTYRGI